jgi:glutathione synthase/RimK-type ligase-like ATP-grasp enzyme
MLLIVTEQFDPHADFVEPALDERGIPWRRFHLGDFPADVSAGIEINGNVDGTLNLPGEPISLRDIHAVWYRRTEKIKLPADLDEGDSLLIERETRAFVQGLWRLLDRVRWVSNPEAVRQASCKAEQLVRAPKFGFRVPPTCISNDPKYVRAFLDRLGQETEVIYKPHTPIMIDQAEGKKGVVYTTRLDQRARERLDEIRLTPGIFQAYIPKRLELRVTVVHDAVFACAIDSQSVAETQTDWRAHRWGDASTYPRHEAFALPEQIADACRNLVSSYGLMFGAIDLILDPAGQYHFLELNPNGQWAWIQQITGQQIREKLCSVFQER